MNLENCISNPLIRNYLKPNARSFNSANFLSRVFKRIPCIMIHATFQSQNPRFLAGACVITSSSPFFRRTLGDHLHCLMSHMRKTHRSFESTIESTFSDTKARFSSLTCAILKSLTIHQEGLDRISDEKLTQGSPRFKTSGFHKKMS